MVVIRSKLHNERRKPIRQRRKPIKLSAAARKRFAQARKDRKAALTDAINQLRCDVEDMVGDAAAQLEIDSKVAFRQVLGLQSQAPRRSANAWNGYLRRVMKEANEGRALSSRLSVNEVVTDAVRARYQALTPAEKAEILDEHEELRQDSQVGRAMSDRSDHQLVLAKFKALDQALESLHHQHGIEFLFVGVRSNTTSYAQPHIVTSPIGEAFWRVTMPQGIHEWAARMEAYSVGGLQELAGRDTRNGQALRGEIRSILQDKLVSITNNPKVIMSYARFEQDITSRYGVVLEGWPFPTLRNLADERASNDQLRKLLDALITGKCFFRKLTPVEVQARQLGAMNVPISVARARAPRKDKGIPRGPQKVTRERASPPNAHAAGLSTASDIPIDPALLEC